MTSSRGPARLGAYALVLWALTAQLLLPAVTAWHVACSHGDHAATVGTATASTPRDHHHQQAPADEDSCPTCRTLALSRVTPMAPIESAPASATAAWTAVLIVEASPIRATRPTPRSTRGPPTGA